MGIGECNPTDEYKLQEGLMNPIKTKDPESSAATHTKGTFLGTLQKLRSRRVALVYVVCEAAVIVILLTTVIVVASQRVVIEKIIHVRCKDGCKDGWIMHRDRCYYISENYDTWNNSQKFCKEQKSSLVIIHNKEEYDFLNRIKGDNNHWIGLSRTKNNDGWVWTDGTPYSESNGLFTIQRLDTQDGDLERAYLNNKGVKSRSENVLTKYFCSTELIFQPS